MKTLTVLLFCSLMAAGDSAVQTDWFSGPGEHGPVDQWSTSFSHGMGADYESQQGQVSITWGKLTDSERTVPGSQSYAIGAYAGDVDLDGDLDILAASSVDNFVRWWENSDGIGSSWVEHEVASSIEGAWGVLCSDIDQDGDNDLFGSAMGSGIVLWWENSDGSGENWTEHMIDDSLAGAKAILIADINGDGLDDLAAAAKTDNVIVWYQHSGTGGSWTKIVIAADYHGANSVYAVDMDGDGDQDILAAAKSDKAIRWFENADGTGTSWTAHSVVEDLDYARTAEAVDMDGDGDQDVIGTGGISKASGRVCWWENIDGGGTVWSEHTINDDFQGPYTVLHHDMDSDGDPDIVSGSLTFNAIFWWENNGLGSEWNEHQLCSYYAPRTVSVADLDSDGAPEVFAGSLYGFDIKIWEVFGYGEAYLVSSILDTHGDSHWTDLNWTAETPSETQVGVTLRASWDPQNMGEWSDTVYSSPVDPEVLVGGVNRFVQYAVVLESIDPDITPVLNEIELSWNPLGIVNETLPPLLTVSSGNPSPGSLSLSYTIPAGENGSLKIYDLSGRMVVQQVLHTNIDGTGTVCVTDLTAGVYLIRLDHSGVTRVCRVTVI